MHPFKVTSEMVNDILCAALEGGINYWAARVEVIGGWPEGVEYASDAVARGAKLRVHIDPELDDQTYILRLANIKTGIRKAAELRGQTVAAFYEDHDAEAADLAVQFALFGEVIYG